jgi:hypothetical protein
VRSQPLQLSRKQEAGERERLVGLDEHCEEHCCAKE